MKNFLALLLILCTYTSLGQSNSYTKAWQALNENKKSEAADLFSEAANEPASYEDAYISSIYLKTYVGKENIVNDFSETFYTKSVNPYPYIYAMWFNDALLGQYGKKVFEHQTRLIDKIISDDKAPGTLVAAANYQRGMDVLFSGDFKKAQQYYDAIGNIKNWQYTGPFENLSQSGFNKTYGPIEHPAPDAVFKSITNTDVKWFTPSAENKDGWTPVCYQFNKQTAIVYAQNFAISSIDQSVYCAAGFTGSAKVWINDELVIAESKERITEMDEYTVKVDLKKGVNRILVQLGFTNSTYPNFSIRFTDEKFNQVHNISGSSSYAPYPKFTGADRKYEIMPPFAEKFFKDKIISNPDNLVNYLLLADVYLRNKKTLEARDLVTEAVKRAPDNTLLRFKMLQVLQKENNKTLLLEELEKIKQLDPESLTVIDLNIKEDFDNEKYDDGSAELDKRIRLYGEDETTSSYKILLLGHEKRYEDLVKEAENMYRKYPGNAKLQEMMYVIKKNVYKDNKGALQVYEKYMKNNFNYEVYNKYADLLAEAGQNNKALDVKIKLAETFPFNPTGYYELSKYHYAEKQYDKAEEQIRKALNLSPYTEKYWEELGDIKSEKKNNIDALAAYNQSLKYDPNQYDIINKVRKLNEKPEIYKLLPEIDIIKTIKDDKLSEAKNVDYGYYYILDQKDVIIYPGGANEEYYTTILKITNEKGIDRYKESSISYTESQSLLIEKAQVIKQNQSQIDGERNGNQIVFTNLEVGDVVVFKYRLQSFVYGRFAREYWDKYYCNGQVYSSIVRYNLLVPADEKLNYIFSKSTIQPVIKAIENFKEYSWEMVKPEPLKNEPLMPALTDVGAILHVSTIPSWKEIANWYSDICNNKAEEDFEIIGLHKKLFPYGQKPMSQFQKAKIIYNYIQANIRYSSVSFRQSAFVPQRASATLTTRLGDCKDLSSLFVTLAHMTGINAQMVLVDTRDNGERDITLPSVEFNHCIVKAMLDNKSYYIELTDNYLPFASLPNNLNGAEILEIPSATNNTGEPQLQLLKTAVRSRDAIKRTIEIKPNETDLNINVKSVVYGTLTSRIRSHYLHLDNEKQMQDMEKSVANGYRNNIKLQQLSFNDLDKLDDSVNFIYSFRVKNEVSQIGSLKTFKIIYPDMVASLDNFTADTRLYPIEYWNYEDADNYETTVNIIAPAGKKFVELPVSQTFTFKDMKFTLTYQLKAPDKLTVIREFTNGRQNIPASDYVAFKTFFEKIVAAEQNFIAYK